MSGCCCPPRPENPTERRQCPRSGTAGTSVNVQTVKALLISDALARISSAEYRFCPDPSCEVVYFDGAEQVFTVRDIRVPVWQKEPVGARTICYCFGENEAQMRESAEPAKALERVRAHIAAGRCACELRNPKGSCCLGDVIAAVQRAEASRRELPNR